MSKMREAFERWIMLQPSHKTERLVTFEAGYQAAIADVKAGGAACWVHPTYLQENALGIECSPVQFGPQQIPLYKLPEDV